MVRLRDVTLRDGLQDVAPIDTDEKMALFEFLVSSGVTDMEVTSFVRPDRVPALADADQLCRRVLALGGHARLWGLVLNLKGAELALAVGLRHLQFVLSVSEPHNLENAGQSVSASLDALVGIIELVDRSEVNGDATGVQVEVTLATAFGCPFAGPVDALQVRDVAQRARDLGVRRLTLADTIGTAVPTEVRALVNAIRTLGPLDELGLHLHVTRGLALANALAGFEAGVDRLDGTVGGLGGCPFAPAASGNLPLEDLVHMLGAMGYDTGIDLNRLLEASALACELTDSQPTSHVAVAGPRFAARSTTQ